VRVVDRLDRYPHDPRGSVVTIGVYDGVHPGHLAVLRLVRELADARDRQAVCVTFDRHPAELVRPDSAPCLLTDLDQKLELLAATALLDTCVIIPFDEERRREPAEDFVRQVLVVGLDARMVVVGADFHFGLDRGGNVALLERLGAELGFEVLGLGLEATADGTVYSSTVIRQRLAEGDVVGAAKLLGRPFAVRGVVRAGDGRGRDLGFPTANVVVGERATLPADGIYAGSLTRLRDGPPDRRALPAAVSLGRRPTFYDEAAESLLEAHVLDFDEDLYGEAVEVAFVERLRGEQRFEEVEALVEQIGRDVAAVRRIVARAALW
jgi:riboflavin kinase / FMN adenylyltransferase